MAAVPSPSHLLLFTSLCLLFLLNSSQALSSTAKAGKVVGGKTDIPNVATNKEVQALGRFSVEEYNRSLLLGGRREGSASYLHLSFSKVVEAQRQVVSGIKYFLKIAAKDHSGTLKIYHAVVVVKPWLKSQNLLSFVPSPN